MSRKRTDDKELVKIVIHGYLAGTFYKEIAKQTGMSEIWVCNMVQRLKKIGAIPKERPTNKRAKVKEVIENQPPGTVRCTPWRSKKCIYGVGGDTNINALTPLCNYLLCTGHTRGCPAEACTKYQEGTKKRVKY